MLKSDYDISRIWYARDLPGKLINQLERLVQKKEIELRAVDKNDIQKLTGPVVHQGMAAETVFPLTKSTVALNDFLKTCSNPFLVVLDQIQDPHNLGAILRTAEICGVDALILPDKGSAQLNATVAKTSAGALFHLNIFKVDHLENVLLGLNDLKISTCALMPDSDVVMYKTDLSGPVAVIVGSEGAGVRKNITNLCSTKITIPQFGKIESLNASVAAAVVFYEVLRQRSSR